MGITDPSKTVSCERVLISKNLEVLQTPVQRVSFFWNMFTERLFIDCGSEIYRFQRTDLLLRLVIVCTQST